MNPLRRREVLAGAALAGATLGLGTAPSRAVPGTAPPPWFLGCNFIPSTAVNQLDTWQAETFDLATLDRELGWAAGLGMNAVRVFLHDLVWLTDAKGFRRRIDAHLSAAARHGLATLFVLFDSCWDPFPVAGPQKPPRPGVHNSRWVQSPGAAALTDRAQRPRLEAYVRGVVAACKGDARVLGWDVWNEPDNRNAGSYGDREPPDKDDRVLDLLPRVFDWARSADPTCALTSPLWVEPRTDPERFSPAERIQIEHSTVLSFHCYGGPDAFTAWVRRLRPYGRPLLCTEYMARPLGSTVGAILPLARDDRVAAFNWGLVAGRTQTTLPWDTWQRPAPGEPPLWFHDLLRADGRPYRDEEASLLRRCSSSKGTTSRAGAPAAPGTPR